MDKVLGIVFQPRCIVDVANRRMFCFLHLGGAAERVFFQIGIVGGEKHAA